ncbi:MAG TPA: IS21 family transposase [Patescibacteria group bacterium]
MLKIQEINKIKDLIGFDYNIKQISEILGISLATVYKYKAISNLNSKLPTDSNYPSKLAPFVNLIEAEIKRGVFNSVKIHRKLTENGCQASYSLVNSLVRDKVIQKKVRKQLYQRVETAPAEQAQVDWGHFGKIIIDGQKFNLYVFAYQLAYSRIIYAEFVTSQKQLVLQRCHIHAFNKLGVPKKIRYDNMKTVVTSRKKVNDKVYINYNFEFLNFAKYYKFEPEACPPYYPQSKGKIESTVKYIKSDFIKGEKFNKTFKSIDELNQKLWLWIDNVANVRVHATTHEKPIERWMEEKGNLFFTKDYPIYENNIRSSRRASQNSMVTYKLSAYGVPPLYARKKIDVVEKIVSGVNKLYFYFKGKKIMEHNLAKKRGEWILPETLPSKQTNQKKVAEGRLVEVQERDLEYYNQFFNQ